MKIGEFFTLLHGIITSLMKFYEKWTRDSKKAYNAMYKTPKF